MSVFLLAAAFYTGINYIEGSFGSAEDFGYRVLYQEIAGIGSGEEYLPLETTRDDLTTPNIAFSDIGEQTTGVHQQGIFQFTASPDTQYYDIPLVWYKGYTACTEDGIRLEIIKNPENGHVCVQTDSLQDSAQVNVQYSGTTLMRISYAISFISLLTILIILTVKSLKHR